MTWLAKSKITGQSWMTGAYTITVPVRVLAQSASATADYETSIWSPLQYVQQSGLPGPGTNIGAGQPYTGLTATHIILAAWLITDTAITGTGSAGAGATAKINLYNTSGSKVGALFTLQFNTNVNTSAFVPKSLGATSATVRNNASKDANTINKNEGLTFEWLQGGTGLALPAAVIVLDVI